MKNINPPGISTGLIFVLTFTFSSLLSQIPWQQLETVDQVCQAFPHRMKTMLQSFDLELEGLQEVKKAYQEDHLPKACAALLNYYSMGTTAMHLRIPLPAVSGQHTGPGDSILQNIFTFQRVKSGVPHLPDGHLHWEYTGPEDDIEWAWALNRHYPVAYLWSEYLQTGNPDYARYMDHFLKDWIIASWPYPAVKSSTAMWRGLEVSFRVKLWAKLFYAFLGTEYLSPATRLLILSSLPDHAHYARQYHGHTNWLTMEMSGLATVATAWPELKKSAAWLDYAIERMTESMEEQVYPDGAQTELTAHYHRVALSNFYLFQEICQKAGIALPESYTDQIENMWNYLAWIMRPDGNAPLNNDSDLDFNRERILQAAKEYGRADWLYIASNGKEGTPPEEGPSQVFPWAGQMISRSGYEKEAHWSFFDLGPWGSGHQHNDKLHLSVAAFGMDLLVDAGRFAYRGEVAQKFRPYARGSEGHNVLLIDGKGQAAGAKLAAKPLSEDQYVLTDHFDFARGSMDKFKDIAGEVSHTRSMIYVRDAFWIVLDQVRTDRPRQIEALWHWHPNGEVKLKEDRVAYSADPKGHLQIIPLGKTPWKVRLVKGQEDPAIQGWYSQEYNIYHPNTTSIYQHEITASESFVWLLYPSLSPTDKVKAQILHQDDASIQLSILDHQGSEWVVVLPLKEEARPVIEKRAKE